jgi:heme oxygenase (biliverdin-IX-beta and delta-forming)
MDGNMASLIRQQLKRDTTSLHRRLETDLGLLDADLSVDRYRRILELFLGFYSPIEARMGHVVSAGLALGFPLRPRSGLIETDLRSIGLSDSQVANLRRCVDLPRLSSVEELAGCLYVIEGACLGGQLIAPALRDRLGVIQTCGAAFFVGDAERTGERWRLFLIWLEDLVRAGGTTEEIVTSARDTFLALALWVEQAGFAAGRSFTD